MLVELTDEERHLLRIILEERLHELDHEISRTDHRAFKAGLREREAVLSALLEKVTVPEPLAA